VSILLIEDDLPLADGLARALRQEGYRVDVAGTAVDACRALDEQSYGVIVLDLGLPDLDGSEVLKHLVARKLDTPVLVLSARDGLEERVRLLDIGADDYLVKPAAMDEFLARVRAMLRRRRSGARLVLGRLSLDVEGRRAYVDDQPLDLNSREWVLLAFLAVRLNRAVPKEDIAVALYGTGEEVSVNALDQIMSRFRKRIADSGLNLRTVRGLGYYLEVGHDGD
jgi:two-component system, OmpR family, response regulator